MSQCPCGLPNDYLACCGLYIEKQAIAKTPEALMRSRYTAYTQAKIDYIKSTMRGKPLENFNQFEAAKWAKQVHWLGLQVIASHLDETNKNIGYVEFIASFMEEGKTKTLHELSQFHCDNDHWFYTDSLPPKTKSSVKKPKMPRNAPCPCGSQKKFKNCHGSV